MKLNVEAVRDCYPALADGYAYLDGAAGTQVPAAVIERDQRRRQARSRQCRRRVPGQRTGGRDHRQLPAAVAALTGGEPAGVVLGPNMTTLTYRLAGALAKDWRPGDEVVVSTARPRRQRPALGSGRRRAGAVVRWAEVDSRHRRTAGRAVRRPAHATSTRLVAVTRRQQRDRHQAGRAGHHRDGRAAGALATSTGCTRRRTCPVDVRALGADFYATSAYKWSGPHIGTVVADPRC